ncbi:MAG: MOSC domain-containing protein [Hyphomonadaceae bacterium]|nr:MOSC domain-containing protein [Hyphomonadaceae bacterium]
METSIFKTPTSGPVFAGLSNLAGDEQADLSVHGGRDKAIYVYSKNYYAEWQAALARPVLEAAQFGENLTVNGCRDEDVLIGARYRVGDAVCTVTQPRVPCFKLGLRIGDDSVPARFWQRGQLGFYLRVEHEGDIRVGDALVCAHRPSHGISVRHLWEAVTQKKREDAHRALRELQHLDLGWRQRLRAIVAAGAN